MVKSGVIGSRRPAGLKARSRTPRQNPMPTCTAKPIDVCTPPSGSS
jgi:hypothetical protein